MPVWFRLESFSASKLVRKIQIITSDVLGEQTSDFLKACTFAGLSRDQVLASITLGATLNECETLAGKLIVVEALGAVVMGWANGPLVLVSLSMSSESYHG